VDYYLRPKLCYFAAKRAFEPIILSITCERNQRDKKVKVHLINDKLTHFEGDALIRVIDFEGKELYKKELRIKQEANSNRVIFDGKINIENPSYSLIIADLIENSKSVYRNFLLFEQYKNLNLPTPELKFGVERLSDSSVRLTLETESFIPAIKISTPHPSSYSDNFLFLFPKEKKEVIITSSEKIQEINIRGLNITRRYILDK